MREHTAVDGVRLFVRNLDAELLQDMSVVVCVDLRTSFIGTSSMAMTTSTVSRLSSPKSFAKCDVFDSCRYA